MQLQPVLCYSYLYICDMIIIFFFQALNFLVESFGLLNDLFPLPSILAAGYPVFDLHLANVLFDVGMIIIAWEFKIKHKFYKALGSPRSIKIVGEHLALDTIRRQSRFGGQKKNVCSLVVQP